MIYHEISLFEAHYVSRLAEVTVQPVFLPASFMDLPKEYGPSRDTQTLSYAGTDDIPRLSKAFMET